MLLGGTDADVAAVSAAARAVRRPGVPRRAARCRHGRQARQQPAVPRRLGARAGGVRARRGGRARTRRGPPHRAGQLRRPLRRAGAAAARARLRRRHLPPRHRGQGPHAGRRRGRGQRRRDAGHGRRPATSTATPSPAALGHEGVPRHAAAGRADRRRSSCRPSTRPPRVVGIDGRAAPIAIDLSDDETFRDGFPHERFAWLRAHDPVHWHAPTARTPDGEGFWVVSRHADVSAVLRDPVTFSSDRGGIREQGRHGDQGRAHRRHDAQPDRRPAAPAAARRSSTGASRRVPSPSSPTSCAGAATTLLDAVGDEPFDFVHGFARELPSQAICLVLGVSARPISRG